MHSARPHNILDRPHVMEHITRAVANGLDRRVAQKLIAAWDLGLITCHVQGHGEEMAIEYTALGHIWDCQGQQWGHA